jgi:hypothetical protein
LTGAKPFHKLAWMCHLSSPRVSFLAICLFCAVTSGCGPDNPLGRKALSGSVKLDGSPLEKGTVEFQPLDGGVQSGGLISGGSYSIPAHQGATPGKYRVVIFDTYDTPPLPAGHMPGDDVPKPPKSKVPPSWNSKSQQTIEVKKEGPFKFDFDVVTKGK